MIVPHVTLQTFAGVFQVADSTVCAINSTSRRPPSLIAWVAASEAHSIVSDSSPRVASPDTPPVAEKPRPLLKSSWRSSCVCAVTFAPNDPSLGSPVTRRDSHSKAKTPSFTGSSAETCLCALSSSPLRVIIPAAISAPFRLKVAGAPSTPSRVTESRPDITTISPEPLPTPASPLKVK